MLLATFLASLDQTVVATAGPDIMRALSIDAGLYPWVTTAYLVAATVLVPVYGRLSDLVGRKQVVLFGVLLFVVASVLCGFSWSSTQLIVFRALQGAGSASIFTSAFAIIGDLYPPAERGRVTGVFGAVFAVSSVVGPLLGGVLTDTLSWHWVFFINAPLGALALTVIAWKMPSGFARSGPTPTLDVPGVVLLVTFLVPLLIALSVGRPAGAAGAFGYPWGSWQVAACLLVSLIAGLVFIWFELRTRSPLVDLRLLGDRSVGLGLAVVFVLGAVFMTPVVFLPLYLVNVVGVKATAAGLTVTPLVLGVVAGNLVAGQLASRFGRLKLQMLVSLTVLLVGCVVMGLGLRVDSTQAEVTRAMVVVGLGLGPAIPLYTMALQNAVAPARLGAATALLTFSRQLGSTVGLAVVGSLFATTLSTSIDARLAVVLGALPAQLSERFDINSLRVSAAGDQPARFDAEQLRARSREQLEGARALAREALEGDALSAVLVSMSPLADEWLAAIARAGGVRAQLHAHLQVLREQVQTSPRRFDGVPPQVQALVSQPQVDWAAVDAEFATYEAHEAQRQLDEARARIDAEFNALAPVVMAAIDQAEHAVKQSFTEAIRLAYACAVVLAALALLLTALMREPQRAPAPL